jgi:hypothetical protein
MDIAWSDVPDPWSARPAPGHAYLDTLEPGTRFAVDGKAGTLVRVGSCSCKVQYDGSTLVEVAGKSFARPLTPVEIAPRTEVIVLDSLPETL